MEGELGLSWDREPLCWCVPGAAVGGLGACPLVGLSAVQASGEPGCSTGAASSHQGSFPEQALHYPNLPMAYF